MPGHPLVKRRARSVPREPHAGASRYPREIFLIPLRTMTSPAETRRPCILLADDDADIRRLLEDVLTKEGFQVLVAADGADALKHARKHVGEIDLLITDVEMPMLDGFDLQERLRQEQPNIKLLVISGALDSNIAGADFALLRKPFLPTELAAKVREILGDSGNKPT